LQRHLQVGLFDAIFVANSTSLHLILEFNVNLLWQYKINLELKIWPWNWSASHMWYMQASHQLLPF